ncbi:MAG: phosphomannomutase/phosphoglucomutase [Clostridiaceae bacterium]|jgi:phosphomannomutase / phosphoglucomutase|nr:phosphomannomutase/phosphoglucomutase [Clostridiaceae bacterium]
MQKYEHAFGKNDIRGIYGEDITEELYYALGRGYTNYLKTKSGLNSEKIWITVARDARLHSPSLAKALIDGILSTGSNVVDLGLAPTPIGYYSEAKGIPSEIINGGKITGAAIITASHNPKEYNGLKMTYSGCTLNESEIKEVKELTFKELSVSKVSACGILKTYDLISDYIKDMIERFGNKCEGVSVVVDSANATGGLVGPKLYKKLGCKVTELFSEPDGNFPNHHPNPSIEKTLDTLKETVVKTNSDVGIAYDGDSDRIGVIDNKGNYLTGDKLLLIYAQDLISDGLKPTVVSEVKCSQVLFDTIDKLGGHSVMCKTGHGYIKGKMKETNAILAGEMSGHTFFKDRYYGFDDAVYAGCRILEIIAKNKKINPEFTIQDMLKPFDEVYSSPEVRYPCPNEMKKTVLAKVQEKVQSNKNIFGSEIKDIITLDGMRIVFEGGFALIRQSNTEPVFTLRFEAKTKDECDRFKNKMIEMLDSELNSVNV